MSGGGGKRKGNEMAKGRKISDLARVTYLGMGDGITGTGHMEVKLLGTGETLHWRPNGGDWEWITGHIASVRVGEEIAIEGFAYDDSLRRVRYSTVRGRSFRGIKFHVKHGVAQ